jgi:hypothetical protein
MTMSLALAWKVALTTVLLGTIVLSARARAPRRALPRADMHRLVGSAIALYAVGLAAWATGHPSLAVTVFGAGIATAALAAWLSRGDDPRRPPDDDAPVDEQPPLGPDGHDFDWEAFERDLAAYAERTRSSAPSSR